MKFFVYLMGLVDIVHKAIGEFINYEEHSLAYAAIATAVGVVGGVASGFYAAAAGADLLYTTLATIGGYAVSRFMVGSITHLKNIYKFATGQYADKKEPKKAPSLAPSGNLVPAPAT